MIFNHLAGISNVALLVLLIVCTGKLCLHSDTHVLYIKKEYVTINSGKC